MQPSKSAANRTTVFIPTPANFGLPSYFTSWRTGQLDAILATAESPCRFTAANQPTGTGKSVYAVATGLFCGGRTVIATGTKLLMDQYTRDFAPIGMADMRGQGNFPCSVTRTTCAEGQIHSCPLRNPRVTGCPYISAREEFLRAPLAVTNYDYLLSSNIYGDGIGPVETLVLDEGHMAVQQLADAVTIKFEHRHYSDIYHGLTTPPPYKSESIPTWQKWAAKALATLSDDSRKETFYTFGLAKIKRLTSLCERLTNDAKPSWIFDGTITAETHFSPVWPTEYAQRLLFAGAKRVIIMSATLVPKTLSLLDVDPDNSSLSHHLHTPYSFPAHRAPVYIFGAHRISHKSTDADWQQTIGRMDTIIKARQDRKGIVQSVSYDRQKFIASRSFYSDIMLTHTSNTLTDAVTEFRNSPPPRLLVSPSLTTGYDFPDSDCEYQLLCKVPFVDTRSPIMQARISQDPEYPHYLTAQTLVQMCGRPMRSAQDQCENFILDLNAKWFLGPKVRKGYRHLLPPWFFNLIRYPDGVPEPPPPLPSYHNRGQNP